MICSWSVGGSIEVGRVLRSLLKRGQRDVKIYAIIICKYVVQLLAVRVPAPNLSMQFTMSKGLNAYWAGLGVQLVSLRC